MQKLLFALVALLSSPAFADVVTDMGSLDAEQGRQAPWLYFRDGGKVYQTRCPATGLRDRTSCSEDRRSVSATEVILQLLARGPQTLDAAAQKGRDLQLQIERVDRRRLELMSSQPDDATVTHLREQLQQQEADLASLEGQVRELADQVRQIREQPGTDPDLGHRLAQLEGQLLDFQKKREDAARTCDDTRNALVEALAHGSSSQEYQELTEWRAQLATDWKAAQAEYLALIGKAAAARRLALQLDGSGDLMAIEILAGGTAFKDFRPYAPYLDLAFERAAAKEGTSPAKNWYVRIGTGRFVDAARGRAFTITKWDRWFAPMRVAVLGVPDLKEQCWSSVDADDLDWSRMMPQPVEIECSSSESCYVIREQANPQGNRIYWSQVGISFLGDDSAILELWASCYYGSGSSTLWDQRTWGAGPASRQE